MKEKIKELLNKIKEKIEGNEALSEKLNMINEKLQTIASKLPKRKRKRSSSSIRKAKRVIFIKGIVYSFALTISLCGITLFGYSTYDLIQAKQAEKNSNYYIIKANLNFAKASLLDILKNRKVKRKNIRRIVKKLNGEDDFGRMYNFSPCDSKVLAYGETPYPGNVTIIKKYYNPYGFVITAHNCKVEPIESIIIKIKKPPRVKKDKKGASTATHNNKHNNTKQNSKSLNSSSQEDHTTTEKNEKAGLKNEKESHNGNSHNPVNKDSAKHDTEKAPSDKHKETTNKHQTDKSIHH